jgi:flagellar hook assembly protein FlgD
MKKGSWTIAGIGAALALAIVSCQTTRQAAGPLMSAAPSSIATESQGFSPKAEAGRNSIDFALTLGNPEKARAWKVEMKSAKGAQKTFSGTGSSVPVSLSWDGKDDSGGLAPEGKYSASLEVDYTDTYRSTTATSTDFLLDVAPPSGKLVVAPANPVPTGNGFASPASITIDADSKLAKIDSWSLDILDPDGKVFRSFSDKWPGKTVGWDGLSSGGAQALPATTYKAVATVRDEFGNTGELDSAIAVADIPSASGSTSIEARHEGFAPKGESSVKTMDLDLAVGQKAAVKAWRIAISLGAQGVQKTYSGDSADLPSSVSWDGRSDSGDAAPEGRYVASLKIDYGAAFKPAAVQSKSFVLDLTPPSGTIVADPPSLTPDGKGGLSPMTFTIVAASDLAPLASWDLSFLGLREGDRRRPGTVSEEQPPVGREAPRRRIAGPH